NADVRMSGVTIGRVASVAPHGRTARATLELDSKYAPIAADSRAILRQKTLLGETYCEITPGSRSGPRLAEDSLLPARQVSPTTAHRDAALTQSIRILPTTLSELRPTLDAVTALSHDAAPVVHALRPGGSAFAPALRDTAALAPEVRTLFAEIDRLASAASTG